MEAEVVAHLVALVEVLIYNEQRETQGSLLGQGLADPWEEP